MEQIGRTSSMELPYSEPLSVITPLAENAADKNNSMGSGAEQLTSASAESQPMSVANEFGFAPSDTHLGHNSGIMASPAHGTPSLSPLYDNSQRKDLLKRQIEYYFSRDNLNHDPYLVSQMDADQYVDISIIANFNQVRKLTSDHNLIVEVLRDSHCVQVDETEQKIRPLHKRSVVILREIPEGTTQQEIEEIFTHSNCPSFVSCEYASGNCWYVNFDTEEQAQDAFRYIRETLQTFKGQRIMARIKAKPSAASSTAPSRPEQQRADGSVGQMPSPAVAATVESLRTQVPTQLPPPTTPSAIRYPVPLHHFPLQSPQAPPAYPFAPYMQYVIPHALLQPQWNGFLAEANFANPYDFNNYGYPMMPSAQPRPVPSNAGRSHSDRRIHSVGSSGAGGSDRLVESASSSVQTSTTSTAPKNSTLPHSGYYSSNSRNHTNHVDSSNFYKQGEKPPQRGRYTGNHSTHDHHYNNADNIPPRHRAQHKQRVSHNNHPGGAPGSQSHMSSGPPPRRPINQGRAANNSMTNNIQSGSGNVNHIPHYQRDQRAFSSTASQSAGHDGSSRAERSAPNREYSNSRQSASFDQQSVHNRNHGARRNSKSPEKDIEHHPSPDAKSHTFNLDSNAFPALPGAITSASPAVNTISQPHSDNATTATATAVATTAAATATSSNNHTQIANATNDNSSSTSAIPFDSEKMNGNVETVSKLSDIVKNNIPDIAAAAKLSDIVKGVNKLSISNAQVSSQKDLAEKPTSQTRNHSSKNPSGAVHHRNRPTHLTNGSHSTADTPAKGSGKPMSVKSSIPSAKVPTDVASGKPTPKPEAVSLTQAKRKNSGSDTAGEVSADKMSTGQQVSPIDHKLSYAAMAQRVAAANPPVPPKLSPAPDSASVTASSGVSASSSSGDNNNNADNKPASKNDNLYSSTAAKNTVNAAAAPTPAVTSNGPPPPRKPAQSQSMRNGPLKPKGSRAPTSPPSRSASASHATSSAVVAR